MGPVQAVNNQIRGCYDEILEGLYNLRSFDVPVSLSTVMLRNTIPFLPLLVQTADTLGIAKVKMVIPVARGRAKMLSQTDYAPKDEIVASFEQLKQMKTVINWKPRLKFAFWDEQTKGYALIIDPQQLVWAWPIPEADDGAEFVGDLGHATMQEIWIRYPYKENHVNKYIGRTMYLA